VREERIGDCRLILGDCLEVLPTLGPVDAVVTSPPYNQMTGLMREPSGSWAKSDFGRSFVENWQTKGYTDDIPEEEYQVQQNSLFALIGTIAAPNASLFYNHQIRWRDGNMLHPIDWFKPAGWKMRSEIIWDRGGGMMFNARMFVRFDERILWMTRGKTWKWNQSHVGLGTIWRIAREQNKTHPVAFPVQLPANCIGAATDPNDVVLDPFMGSGSTLVACAKLDRRGVGIEIDPGYFDDACRRVEEAYRQPDMFIERPAPAVQTGMDL
jgi:DNA modification methylase